MAEKQNVPSWLERALDPTTPTTENNETVRTANNYFDDIGAEIIYPTIRMGEDGKLYTPEDPMEEAIKNNDYIVVEGPPNRETAEKAMQISKQISNQISAARTKEDATDKGIMAAEERMTSDTVSFDKGGLLSEEVGKSVAEIPLDIDAERYKAMELRLQEVIPEGAYDLYMKSDSDIGEEYSDLRSEDPEAFDAVLRVNTDVNRQGMDRAQFSVDEAVEGSPIPEIDTYLMENSVYLNAVPPGFERERDLGPRATAQVVPESPIVERTRRGQLPGLAVDPEEQDRVRLHETVHSSGIMGDYDSLATKVFGDVETAEAATTGLDLYRAISRDDPIAARQSINYLISQGVNLFLHRDDLVDNMMRAIDVLEETSDGGIELTPERKVEIRSDIEKEFKNVPRILDNMRLERAGEKEAPKLARGGIMAADGVLIDEIISDLPKEDPFKSRQDSEYERPPVRPAPEDFDPESILQEIFPEDIEKYEEQFPEQEASPDSQYSSEEINTMDKELDQAFSDFENSRGSAADRDAYRNRVREIYTSNPDLFRSQFQDKNTDQLIEMYNELDFSDEEVPFDDEIAETAKYRATVPFGSEDDANLGGGDIFNLSIGRKGTVAGKSRRYDDGVSEVFTPGGADKDLRDNILRHEGLHSLTDHESVRELLAVYPNELLVRAYDVLRGVASGDTEWAEQALKFIEKAYKGKYKKSDIKLILSKLMPLLKEKAAEMNEGGLMADPLVLSETAEEEAEPKMGVGDYIEGAKELITDFSPAGTAQAMIDAAEEAYKLASGAEDASLMNFGIAAIGAIPGGKTATKVVDNASKIADEIAEASLEMSKLDNYVPKKTVTAYKLFTKGEDGNLYPLFVDANKPLPVGEWIKANMPDYIFQAKNGRYYVPSKATAPKTETGKKAFYDTGERKATGSSVEIPDDPELRKKLVEAGFIAKEGTKSVKAVAARPGWHAGDVPIAHHIGAMIDPATGGTKKMEMPNVRRDDQVWAEVELPADVDWQQEALRRANVKKDGDIDVGTAHITDRVPHGGSYRYKTNPNMTGEWLIGGELKINRVLDDAEVKAINNAAGVEDLPRYSEFMDQYIKPKTEMSAGGLMKDDYNRAES